MTVGRKPKSILLHLAHGTYRTDRHGSRDGVQLRDRVPLAKPKHLSPMVSLIWDEQITPAFWLDHFVGPAAEIYCHLAEEYRQNPFKFPAARYKELRAFSSLLGLRRYRYVFGSGTRGADQSPKSSGTV